MTRAGGAAWIAIAAVPLHVALALATDLSPDEAYYLCAARQPGLLPPLVDHPPLLPWMLRLSDGLAMLPVELRVRLWPVALSLALSLACIELARRRGAGPDGLRFVAVAATWSVLPMAGGFVATPDGPALLAIVSLLLWAEPATSPALPGAEPWRARGFAVSKVPGKGAPAVPGNGPSGAGGVNVEDARPRRGDRGATALAAWAAACGALAKVAVVPLALLVALAARGRSARERALVIAGVVLPLPLLLPSLRFQLGHAYGAGSSPWSMGRAAAALAEAAGAQIALWSPLLFTLAASRLHSLARADRCVLGAITVLVAASALIRAAPPEANWWAPGALLVITAGALDSTATRPARSGPDAPRSNRLASARWLRGAAGTRLAAMGRIATACPRRLRDATSALLAAMAIVATAHTLQPFLPLTPNLDPTARLHGWSTAMPPVSAAGVGAYGPAAERCVYRADCDEITHYFELLKSSFASGARAGNERGSPR